MPSVINNNGEKSPFEKELVELINKHSIENKNNTPDFILADYLMGCLQSFTYATRQRDNWYGNMQSPLESERAKKW